MNRKFKSLKIEQLEVRTLPAATLSLTFADGLLTVTAIEVPGVTDRAIVLANLNGEVVVTDQQFYYVVDTPTKPTAANVTSVKVVGSIGNDYIDTRLIGPAFSHLASPVTILGGAGNDQIWGSRRYCYIDAGDGDDAVLCEPEFVHNDYIIGGAGRDTLLSANGDDLIDGGTGNDIISAAGGNDTVYGNSGNDVLYAGVGNDVVLGQGGHDRIYAEDGADIVYGGTGDDSINGGYGNDTLYGQTESDFIRGGQGDDVIYGGEGNDWLDGDQGYDSLDGGWGNDTLYGDSGYDTLNGGEGTDYRSSLENWDRIVDVFIVLNGPLNLTF